jgi:hypothetical protein
MSALAGLLALCAGGGVIVALSALTVLASAGLLVPPSLDRGTRSTSIRTRPGAGALAEGSAPAPVKKETTR